MNERAAAGGRDMMAFVVVVALVAIIVGIGVTTPAYFLIVH